MSPARRKAALTAACLSIATILALASRSQGGEDPHPAASPSTPASSAARHGDDCLTAEELQLYDSLVRRGSELDQRQAELGEREQRLHDLEHHVEERIQAYTALQQSLREEAERRIAGVKEHTKGLAKIYEAMPPSDAAERLTQMERSVAVEILRGMKGQAAGKVLASLDPAAAVELSQRYAAPGPVDSAAGPTP